MGSASAVGIRPRPESLRPDHRPPSLSDAIWWCRPGRGRIRWTAASLDDLARGSDSNCEAPYGPFADHNKVSSLRRGPPCRAARLPDQHRALHPSIRAQRTPGETDLIKTVGTQCAGSSVNRSWPMATHAPRGYQGGRHHHAHHARPGARGDWSGCGDAPPPRFGDVSVRGGEDQHHVRPRDERRPVFDQRGFFRASSALGPTARLI
jgi:hypothetical protein